MSCLGFGKYAHLDITEVPEEYLQWLLDRNRQLDTQIKSELERRVAADEAQLPWVERLVKRGYRELAKQHHPDVGGTTEDMKQINAAFEYVRKLIEREPLS